MASEPTTKPSAAFDAPHEKERGRDARTPAEVPAQGWLDILARTKRQFREDNLTIVAAGVAFYAFVAVVPALAALVALYGLFADPSTVADHLEALASVVPRETLPLLREQMIRLTTDHQAAGIGAIAGLLLAIYASANATKATIAGLNIAYDETEKRSFLKLTGSALILTLGAIVAAVLAVALVAVLPSLLGRLPAAQGVEALLTWIRWPLLAGGFMGMLTVLYRYGPSRQDAQWKWASPGAIVAAVLWLAGSALFSLYVSKFGSYGKTYGPLGAIVVFLLWLYISALAVLIGAEFNSELERQTKRDTTDGREKPLGERGAKSADTVGPSRDELRAPQRK